MHVKLHNEKISRYCELVVLIDQSTKNYNHSFNNIYKNAKCRGYMNSHDIDYLNDKSKELMELQAELNELISELFAPPLFLIKTKKLKMR